MIQLVNFWPDLALDDYINLKERVESQMRISVMTATGDDDYINKGYIKLFRLPRTTSWSITAEKPAFSSTTVKI